MNTAPEHPNRIARISAVLALLGSLIWVQWPIDIENFNIAAIILFFAALLTWIGIEISDYRKDERFNDNILSDDVDKLNKIIEFMDKNQFYTLSKVEIQTYMNADSYKGIEKIIHYKENDIFPFHNNKIQNLYDIFSSKSEDFLMRLYNLYTYDGNGRITWRPSGDRWVSDETYQKIMAEKAILGRDASNLAKLWEELIQISIQELKGASKTINRYEL